MVMFLQFAVAGSWYDHEADFTNNKAQLKTHARILPAKKRPDWVGYFTGIVVHCGENKVRF